MPKKYHIAIKDAPPRCHPIGKYATVEFRERCAGSCRECVKKKCVYGIFKDNYLRISSMEDPQYLYTCQSCFRCIQECTRGIFSRVINPDYRTLGDGYWRADTIHRTWYQAHTGKVPVSGAGYRGPFVAEGFDAMWTDMSEIVRPTRDGIHGREYINTSIELSRKNMRLSFNPDGTLSKDLPLILESQIPVLFQQPDFGLLTDRILLAMARAAHQLDGMLFIRPEDCTEAFMPFADHLVPCFTQKTLSNFKGDIGAFRMVEIADGKGIGEEMARLRESYPQMAIAVGLPLNGKAADRALELTRLEADTLHFYADIHGKEVDTGAPRFVKEMIQEIHLNLIDHSIRDRVNLIFYGGIAMAEHMAKAIICGADGVAVDNPLLIALECRLCHRCKSGGACPAKLEAVELEYGTQRIVNLMGAWRNQLLEVMGAMGIREVRRLRGEVGRSMWFEDLERENFGPIFGERKVAGLG